MTKSLRRAAPLLALAALARPARADEAADRALLFASLNPAAPIVHVPLRSTTAFGIGHKRRTANASDLQPSFAAPAWESVALVHRFTGTLVWSPVLEARVGGVYGLGDLGYELHLSSLHAGPWALALGGGVSLPTSTDRTIGDHKWIAGPSASAFHTGPRHTAGLTVRQRWTFASSGSYPVVDRLVLEPVAAVDLGAGFVALTAPTIVRNRRLAAGDQWTVPLGAGVGRIFSPGGQRIALVLDAYVHAAKPGQGAPEWTVRGGVSFLFPR